MRYRTFLAFDVVGGIASGAGVVLLGHFLGNVTLVKSHVEMVVLVIVIASGLPSIIPVVRRALGRERDVLMRPNSGRCTPRRAGRLGQRGWSSLPIALVVSSSGLQLSRENVCEWNPLRSLRPSRSRR
jgi:hypothetical protein